MAAFHDTPLGFRHGPKAIHDDSTLVVVFISTDPYARAYDVDIIDELGRSCDPGDLLVLRPGSDLTARRATTWTVLDATITDPVLAALDYLVFAQSLAARTSSRLGLDVDQPSRVARSTASSKASPSTPSTTPRPAPRQPRPLTARRRHMDELSQQVTSSAYSRRTALELGSIPLLALMLPEALAACSSSSSGGGSQNATGEPARVVLGQARSAGNEVLHGRDGGGLQQGRTGPEGVRPTGPAGERHPLHGVPDRGQGQEGARRPVLLGRNTGPRGRVDGQRCATGRLRSHQRAGQDPRRLPAETFWDGKQWGFPFYEINTAFAYNKKMFARAGLDPENPPTTWDDFVAALTALKKRA